MIVNETMIARMERALVMAARLVAQDVAILPIFERLDAELSAVKADVAAHRMNDPIARARALAQARKAG